MAFPATASDLEVCVAYGANVASDLTTLTYGSNLALTHVQPRVVITRGRIGGGRTQPTTIDFGLKNPNGVFSPRNISGPHYGQLRRNTPVRVRLDPGTGMVTRAIGYMPDWPVRWTGPDIDDHIAMQASGASRRLGTGRESRSALHRTVLASHPVAYWRVEDVAGSTTLASALPGGPAGTIRPGVTLASAAALPGSTALAAAMTPSVTPGTDGSPANIILPIPDHTLGEEVLTLWHQGTPWTSRPTGGVQVAVRHRLTFRAGGNLGYADIHFLSYDSTGGYTSSRGYYVQIYDQFGAFINQLFNAQDPYDGLWHEVQIHFQQSGADIATSLAIDGAVVTTLTLPTRTLTTPTWFVAGLTGYYKDAPSAYLTPYSAPYSIGHVSLHNGTTPSFHDAGFGYPYELAGARFARLCVEEGIAYDVTAGRTEPMGAQLPGTIVDLLRECEDADEATLIERRTGQIGFDPRASRYNRAVAMTIPYLSVADLQPDDGDRDLHNVMTVTRIGGSSATSERASGPLGSTPTTGVDRYPDQQSRSLASDDQPMQHAAWLSGAGTVDEPRYVIVLNLRAHPELVTQWLACDIGSRILITSPPAGQVGPAPLDVIMEGYQELLDGVEWLVTIYALPYRQYEVLQIQTGTGNRSRIPAGVSTLDAAYSATATSLSVTSAAVRWIDSATYPTKFPITVEIAGEVMTCTGITGTGLTQTFTVTRGLHGVTKPLPITSAVQIWRAPAIAL